MATNKTATVIRIKTCECGKTFNPEEVRLFVARCESFCSQECEEKYMEEVLRPHMRRRWGY